MISRKWLAAYGAWLSFVLVCAAIAAAWYKRVEAIGWRELAKRLDNESAEDATGTE